MALPGLGLDELAGAARGLDLLASGLGEAVRVDGQRLRELAAAQHLDRDALAGREAGAAHGVQVDRGAVVEAGLEVREVDRLRVRPEHLERHRHLLVRAAQLAHAHVDRVLAALEACAALGAGARAVALLATTGGLARARPLAAPDALAVAPGARGRLEGVEADLFAHFSSTVTRWRTAWTMPRSCGESGRCTDLPMPRRPSERSVSRCLPLAPLDDLTWVMVSSLTRPAPRRATRRRPRWSRSAHRPRCHRARARGRRRGRAGRRSPPGGAAP